MQRVDGPGLKLKLCFFVVSTGCGEHLIRTMLARECSTAMQAEDAHQALLEAMQNKFIGKTPTRRRNSPTRLAKNMSESMPPRAPEKRQNNKQMLLKLFA